MRGHEKHGFLVVQAAACERSLRGILVVVALHANFLLGGTVAAANGNRNLAPDYTLVGNSFLVDPRVFKNV